MRRPLMRKRRHRLDGRARPRSPCRAAICAAKPVWSSARRKRGDIQPDPLGERQAARTRQVVLVGEHQVVQLPELALRVGGEPASAGSSATGHAHGSCLRPRAACRGTRPTAGERAQRVATGGAQPVGDTVIVTGASAGPPQGRAQGRAGRSSRVRPRNSSGPRPMVGRQRRRGGGAATGPADRAAMPARPARRRPVRRMCDGRRAR